LLPFNPDFKEPEKTEPVFKLSIIISLKEEIKWQVEKFFCHRFKHNSTVFSNLLQSSSYQLSNFPSFSLFPSFLASKLPSFPLFHVPYQAGHQKREAGKLGSWAKKTGDRHK
jgi:hypothetical protein